jgi:hypothetical protein
MKQMKHLLCTCAPAVTVAAALVAASCSSVPFLLRQRAFKNHTGMGSEAAAPGPRSKLEEQATAKVRRKRAEQNLNALQPGS